MPSTRKFPPKKLPEWFKYRARPSVIGKAYRATGIQPMCGTWGRLPDDEDFQLGPTCPWKPGRKLKNCAGCALWTLLIERSYSRRHDFVNADVDERKIAAYLKLPTEYVAEFVSAFDGDGDGHLPPTTETKAWQLVNRGAAYAYDLNKLISQCFGQLDGYQCRKRFIQKKKAA